MWAGAGHSEQGCNALRQQVVVFSPLGICCREVRTERTAPCMCECIAAGTRARSSVKGKTKVEMLGNNEIQKRKCALL